MKCEILFKVKVKLVIWVSVWHAKVLLKISDISEELNSLCTRVSYAFNIVFIWRRNYFSIKRCSSLFPYETLLLTIRCSRDNPFIHADLEFFRRDYLFKLTEALSVPATMTIFYPVSEFEVPKITVSVETEPLLITQITSFYFVIKIKKSILNFSLGNVYFFINPKDWCMPACLEIYQIKLVIFICIWAGRDEEFHWKVSFQR